MLFIRKSHSKDDVPVNGSRHYKSFVVVGVFSDQVYATGRADQQRLLTMKVQEFIANKTCACFPANVVRLRCFCMTHIISETKEKLQDRQGRENSTALFTIFSNQF